MEHSVQDNKSRSGELKERIPSLKKQEAKRQEAENGEARAKTQSLFVRLTADRTILKGISTAKKLLP